MKINLLNKRIKMKRDLDKIRNIMIYLEAKLQPNKEINSLDLPFYKKDSNDEDYLNMNEHITLLVESNFIKEHSISRQGSKIYYITRITSDGHDFLDALRSESVWNKVKEKTVNAGRFTLSLVVELGKEYIKKELLKEN